jgi:hypothetical protein
VRGDAALGRAVRALQPDWAVLGDIKLGVVGPQAPGADTAFEVRALFNGIEDPVTGSLNASLAQWLIGAGLRRARTWPRKGHALGRDGRVLRADRGRHDLGRRRRGRLHRRRGGAVTFVAVDHLIVAAASWTDGVAWCEATLGVTPGPGGKHPLMGTHNRLLKMASDTYPQAYLEIIAIDPDAPPPTRGAGSAWTNSTCRPARGWCTWWAAARCWTCTAGA